MLIVSGVTIMWPSTNASIPAGWTRVTSMDATYPKGTAAGVDPDVTGGATTHVHTESHTHSIAGHTHSGPVLDSYGSQGLNQRATAGSAASYSHGHVASTTQSTSSTTASPSGTTWSSVDNDPSYYGTIWISSDGTPTGFPASSWAFWDKVDSLPTSWSNPAAARNVFPKGAAASGNGGGTGGGGSHSHSGGSHTHTASGHNHTLTSGTPDGFTGASSGSSNLSTNAHTHTMNTDTGSTASGSTSSASSGGTTYEPTWAKLAIVQNDSGASNLQVRHVALWRGLLSAIPQNWVICDGANSTVDMRGKFVKGANGIGEIGNTGGTAGHSHADASASHSHSGDHNHTTGTLSGTESPTPASNDAPGSAGANSSSMYQSTFHQHPYSGPTGTTSLTVGSTTQTAPSTADTQPPFRTVAFIALTQLVATTITVPAAAAVITTPTFTLTWSNTDFVGAQNDYQYIIYESNGTTIRYDSGATASATVSITTSASAGLVNGANYYVRVIAHDSGGNTSTSEKVAFSTSWSPPTTLSGLTATALGSS